MNSRNKHARLTFRHANLITISYPTLHYGNKGLKHTNMGTSWFRLLYFHTRPRVDVKWKSKHHRIRIRRVIVITDPMKRLDELPTRLHWQPHARAYRVCCVHWNVDLINQNPLQHMTVAFPLWCIESGAKCQIEVKFSPPCLCSLTWRYKGATLLTVERSWS